MVAAGFHCLPGPECLALWTVTPRNRPLLRSAGAPRLPQLRHISALGPLGPVHDSASERLQFRQPALEVYRATVDTFYLRDKEPL
jgi:hypothetical protein